MGSKIYIYTETLESCLQPQEVHRKPIRKVLRLHDSDKQEFESDDTREMDYCSSPCGIKGGW